MKVKLDDWNKFQSNLECTICILAFFLCMCFYRFSQKTRQKQTRKSKETTKSDNIS